MKNNLISNRSGKHSCQLFRLSAPMPACLFALSLALSLALLGICSCTALPSLDTRVWGDIDPPQLLSWGTSTSEGLYIEFSEPVLVQEHSTSPNLATQQAAGLTLENPDQYTNKLRFSFNASPAIGSQHQFDATVRDKAGNKVRFELPFWIPNPNPAKLLIHELATKSSTTIRDCVELLVTDGGNLGGISLHVGLAQDFDTRIILPAVEVSQGEYVLVHFKAEGLPLELDELNDKAQSAGTNAHAEAWDYWVKDSPGIPDSNAVISLSWSPRGPLMDALWYCDKSYDAEKPYGGFGSQSYERRVHSLVQGGDWLSADFSEAVRSEHSTATRTLNRRPLMLDSNSSADWYTAASSGATLGAANSGIAFEPNASKR